jgi:hypothetical protein
MSRQLTKHITAMPRMYEELANTLHLVAYNTYIPNVRSNTASSRIQ